MPAIQISHEASGNSIIRPSPSNNRNPRPNIQVQHLGVGYIVWLPSKGDDDDTSIICIRDHRCSNRELHEHVYDHLVVVLKVSKNAFGESVCSISQVRYD